MADNTLFSTLDPHRSFDNEGLEILPLLTKERTQKFELLQHLIPNLKQHLIVSGASGIGKTFLLDQLYDLNSDAWQCCFVQGSSELSFETIEAQLTKAMLRNKHASLESAFHNFAEQHKKIVLIIDDAGLLVSGLMTTLIDYAATQNVIKLLFSLTPDARNAHRQTDKALNDCYLLEIPPLSKNQSAFFLRQLAAKPRTYGSLQIDEKLVDKIYHDSQGIPAKIIADFTKLSRQEKNDYTKWLVVFAGVLISAMVINQVIKHFTTEEFPVETTPILPVENIEKAPVSQSESPAKTEQLDIVIPEFQLDIEKGIVTPSENIKPDTAPVEKPSDPTPAPVIEPTIVVEPEKVIESKKSAEPIPATPEPVKVIEPVVEKLLEPSIAFPKVEPAKGMKIQALPEKTMLQAIPIPAPVVKKIDVKPVEKPAEVKKPEPPKVESPKIEPPKVEAIKKVEQSKVELEKDKKTEATLNSTGRYVLQLITLSSEAAVEAFQKKHADLGKNLHVVKSGSAENPRFGLVYGGFENVAEATKAREKLPPEFANALPRKN
jgi:DamX protein